MGRMLNAAPSGVERKLCGTVKRPLVMDDSYALPRHLLMNKLAHLCKAHYHTQIVGTVLPIIIIHVWEFMQQFFACSTKHESDWLVLRNNFDQLFREPDLARNGPPLKFIDATGTIRSLIS